MLLVQERGSPPSAVLVSAGSLRVPVETRLRREVAAHLRRGDRSIEVSLGAIAHIDAGGIGELMRVYRMAVAVNGTLRVLHTTPRVRDLLAVVGLVDLLSPESGD